LSEDKKPFVEKNALDVCLHVGCAPLFDASETRMPAGRRRAHPQVGNQAQPEPRAQAQAQAQAQTQIAMSERMVHHNGTSRCLHEFPDSELKQADGRTLPMTYDPFASRGQRAPPTSFAVTFSQLCTQAALYLHEHGKLPWVPAPHVQRNDSTWSQGLKNKFIDSLFHGQASQTCFVIHKENNLADCQGEILDAGHRYRTIMEFVGLHPETPPFLWKPEPDASSKISLSPDEQRAVSYKDLPAGTRIKLENTTFPVTCYFGLSVQEKSNLFSRMQIQIPLTLGEALSSMSAYKATLIHIKKVFDQEHVQELFTRFDKVNTNEASIDLKQMKHYPFFVAIGYNFFVHASGDASFRNVSVMDRANPQNREYQFNKANGFCTQTGDMIQFRDSDVHKRFFEKDRNQNQLDEFHKHVYKITDVLIGEKAILQKELFQVSLALLHGTDPNEVRVRFLELRRQSQQFKAWRTGLHDVNRRRKRAGGDIGYNSPASRAYREANAEPHWDEKDLEFDHTKGANNGLKLDRNNVWTRLGIFLNPSEETLELRKAQQDRINNSVRRRLDTDHRRAEA